MTIAPGRTEEVELMYRAGSSQGDDRKTVAVHFKEPAAPTVSLTVIAKVRDALSVYNPVAETWHAQYGEIAKLSLDVANYTDHIWSSVAAKANDKWLSTKIVPVLTMQGKMPLQTWRLLLQVDTSKLACGKHLTTLCIRSEGTSRELTSIPIALEVKSPVHFTPSILFFGDAQVGKTVRTSVKLHLAECVALSNPMGIMVHHDLGPGLDVDIVPAGDGSWSMNAALTPRRAGAMDGTVTIEFAEPPIPSLSIMVRGFIGP